MMVNKSSSLASTKNKAQKQERDNKVSSPKNSSSSNLKADNTSKTQLKTSQNSESNSIFQAIGVLEGLVAVKNEEQLTITIEGQTYRLGYTAKSKQRYKALVEKIASQGSSIKKLSVYPQINHNKGQEGYEINFNLVTVANTEEARTSIFQDLEPGEFYLSGFWQYVLFCKSSVIAVLRNYSEKLAQTVERVGSKRAKKILKPNYIPVDSADSSVDAFKYDPDLEKKQQMPRYFVRVKAKFQPEKNYFEAIAQVGESTTQAPKYLK
ncbi:hypothetical protein [Myxosarcina sp. GI1]|uniref:hypothetical protein n=1 Tax=Myxosarcina sp. GI1 TaxID=1541065 RepID=UPI00056B068E|nr:hypothetical protein [Myxosarcina sp. GI1]